MFAAWWLYRTRLFCALGTRMHSIFSSTLKQKVFYTDEDDNTPVFVHKGRSKDTLFWPKKPGNRSKDQTWYKARKWYKGVYEGGKSFMTVIWKNNEVMPMWITSYILNTTICNCIALFSVFFLCYGKFKILHCQRVTIQMRIDMQQPLVGPKAIKSPP